MRLRSGLVLDQEEAEEENMQEDRYSTQAVRGSPATMTSFPTTDRQSLSPHLEAAGPSSPAPANPHPGQQSYPFHPGTDFLLYDEWRNSADDGAYEEQTSHSQSPPYESKSDPYSTSNPNSQPPPPAPSPPPNDYGFPAESERYRRSLTPVQTEVQHPLHRYTTDDEHRGPWSPAAPGSAEQRKESLTEEHPGLKRPVEYEDKVEEELTMMSEKEKSKRKKVKRGKRRASPRDVKDRGRDRDADRDRRGGGQGGGQAVWAS